MLIESSLARDQSSWPCRPSWSSSTWCSRCHTPARCQSRSRRQQMTELPQPSCRVGSSRQGMPVRSSAVPGDTRQAAVRLTDAGYLAPRQYTATRLAATLYRVRA
jgi:hypothetical protein